MSKSLIEKQLNGTLKTGYYYALLYQYDGECPEDRDFDDIVRYEGDGRFDYEGCYDGVQEVLAPVPSYDEYEELRQRIEELEGQNAFECGCVSERDERIKEAEKIIMAFSKNKYAPKKSINDYCKKWGLE